MSFNVTKFKKLKLKEFHLNEKLSKHTTFNIGGNALCIVNITSVKELKKVISFCNKYKIKYFVLGAGSNVLFSDKGYNGIVIKLNFSKIDKVKESGNKVSLNAQSGINLFCLNKFCAQKGFSGLEWSYGIPATLGGAIYSNCGSFNSDISNVIKRVSVLKSIKLGKITLFVKRRLGVKKCKFFYRDSIFKHKNYIILSAKLNFIKKPQEDIVKNMNDCLMSKKQTQPIGTKNAGCIFKNGENYKAAKLIDSLNLKGKTICGAQISTKHCGFIVNKSNATCQNVKDLIQYIKSEVFLEFGIDLKEEIQIIEN